MRASAHGTHTLPIMLDLVTTDWAAEDHDVLDRLEHKVIHPPRQSFERA